MSQQTGPQYTPPAGGSGPAYGPDVSTHSGHYIGELLTWSSDTPPAGCLLCDGSAISRTTYADLFAVVGTTYGAGDGETTFNLPDLRGKFAQGTPADGTTGAALAAGLPEIGGSVRAILQSNATTGVLGTPMQGTGAFAADPNTGTMPYYAAAGTATTARSPWATYAASLSSSVYGNSDTVQPPALYVNYVIVYE